MIGASIRVGDIISDGRGYTYGFHRDYPDFRVWMCTFRGCVKFTRCSFTLQQIKRPAIDFLRNFSQEDFTFDAEKEHSHPLNYGVTRRNIKLFIFKYF